MNFDLTSLERRFWHDLGDVESETDAILHSHIAEAVESTAKVLLPLLPEGADAEVVLSKLDEVATTVHNLVATHSPAVEGQGEAGAAPVAESPSAPEAPATEKEGLIDRIFHRGETDETTAVSDAESEVKPLEADVATAEADVAKVEAEVPVVEKAVGEVKPGA